MGTLSNSNWDELTRAASICLRAWAVKLLAGLANNSSGGGQGIEAAKQIVSEAQQPPST